MCIVYILYNFFMHDMCTSLSVIIIINIQRHQQCETVKPPIKNKKPKTKKLDSHLKNNSCATMMLSIIIICAISR